MIKRKARPNADDLPSGYQFGDAAPRWNLIGTLGAITLQGRSFTFPAWRSMHENAAERLVRDITSDRDTDAISE